MSERERFPEGWNPKNEGYIDGRPMADGRWWCLLPLTMGRVRIVIAEDQFTAGEHWCYSDPNKGVQEWSKGCFYVGDDSISFSPEGWSRHMFPDGSFEYPEIKA